MKSIAVLGHNYALSPANHRFVMSHLCKYWSENGITVKVVLGTENRVSADVIINHVDITVTPVEYINYMENFENRVNFEVQDISKKKYSNNLLSMDDEYKGKVIVKTDANCGGITDHHIEQSQKSGRHIQTDQHGRNRLWRSRSHMNSFNYRVFENLDEVPPGVWTNENLMVEKFIPEYVDGVYQVRYWFFFGDRELNIGVQSDHPVVKGPKITKRYFIDYVPDELREYREKFGFDYGRFDYSIVDGRVNIFDMNRTPTIGNSMIELFGNRFPSWFSDGIQSFISFNNQ